MKHLSAEHHLVARWIDINELHTENMPKFDQDEALGTFYLALEAANTLAHARITFLEVHMAILREHDDHLEERLRGALDQYSNFLQCDIANKMCVRPPRVLRHIIYTHIVRHGEVLAVTDKMGVLM
jgi:hypothetical protein